MDEPLSNLDAKLRVSVREEIREIQRRVGITTLYVTHDQEEALAISDTIAVMQSGKVMQVGTPRAIYERPADPFVAAFVGQVNLLRAKVGGGRAPPRDAPAAGSTRRAPGRTGPRKPSWRSAPRPSGSGRGQTRGSGLTGRKWSPGPTWARPSAIGSSGRPEPHRGRPRPRGQAAPHWCAHAQLRPVPPPPLAGRVRRATIAPGQPVRGRVVRKNSVRPSVVQLTSRVSAGIGSLVSTCNLEQGSLLSLMPEYSPLGFACRRIQPDDSAHVYRRRRGSSLTVIAPT